MDLLTSARTGGVLRLLRVIAVLGLCACTEATDSPPTGLPLLDLGDPTLEIGTVDGPPPYAFAALETVVRLPDGRIAVSDAGATVLSIFDGSGAHVASWGSEGDGPGEFNSLSRLYPLGRDSLMAAERFSGRLSVFGLDGGFGRAMPGQEVSGDSTFVLDSWLYRRFWVEGALSSSDRRRVVAVLTALPIPREAPGYRYVQVGDDGILWVREPAEIDGVHHWTRIESGGVPSGVLTIPSRFTPTHFHGDEVLGIWRGEADVHFARSYTMGASSGRRAEVPAWLDRSVGGDADPVEPDIDRVMEDIRGSIRQMAGAQEVHYSRNMSYTVDVSALERFEQPDDLWVDFIKGDPRGWAAVFVHRDLDRACGLAYGFGIPPGWVPGAITCAPEAGGATGS